MVSYAGLMVEYEILYRVERIENEVWVDLGAERFQIVLQYSPGQLGLAIFYAYDDIRTDESYSN
jgi:hypothetical protein